MLETLFFFLAFGAYSLAMVLYLGYAMTKREQLASIARGAIITGLVLHLISLILRTYVARQMPNHGWYVPWSNWFESFSFFALVIALEYVAIQRHTHLPILGAFVSPIIFAALVMALRSPDGRAIPMLPSALQSHWMAIHVPVMFFTYGLFANTFAVGLAYLIEERQMKSKKPSHLAFRLPSLDEMDRLVFRLIALATPMLFVGVLLGAQWAYHAWGRYWGWDPKETWALITWLVYLTYLFMRIAVGWRGRKTVYLSVIGFVLVIFTYVGVNHFSDLHGFLSTAGR